MYLCTVTSVVDFLNAPVPADPANPTEVEFGIRQERLKVGTNPGIA